MFAEPPPLPPFRAGPMVEVALGMQTPLLRQAEVSGPGPWLRGAVGWDFARWIGVYVAGDLAFFDTNRAPPPPDARSYVLWGVLTGARASIELPLRLWLSARLETGVFGTSDGTVLATYGFSRANEVTFGAGVGSVLEWRAPSRRFGVFCDVGLRSVGVFESAEEALPLALTTAIGLHYTF